MALKLVVANYENKCKKCGRDIKKGWDIYFNPDTKEVFCKPCGEAMQNEKTDEAGEVSAVINMVGALSQQLSGACENMADIKSQLVDVTTLLNNVVLELKELRKPTTKTTTKKK